MSFDAMHKGNRSTPLQYKVILKGRIFITKKIKCSLMNAGYKANGSISLLLLNLVLGLVI